jgi:acetylornithine deacetylase
VNATEILRELVAIATPSPLSNLPLLEWVQRFVTAKGWRVEYCVYADENGVAKANMVARPATIAGDTLIELAFVCHTDTVPFPAAWADALQLRAVNGQLHGCGACDVKGALACFLAALESLSPKQTRPHIALILSADEEIGCKGMERLLAATNLRIRSAIVSEPTSLRPGIAGKGYGLARVTVHGVEAHSAYPTEGASAVNVAARFITRLQELRTSDIAEDVLFDPPQTTVNVGVIQGGTAKNIVPGTCWFLVEWRPIPADPPRAMVARLEAMARDLQNEIPRVQMSVDVIRAEAGFAPVSAGPLQQRLALEFGEGQRSPMGISFGSEASRLAQVAEEVIVIGPGDMHTAHSNRECVPVAELEEWTRVLERLLTGE